MNLADPFAEAVRATLQPCTLLLVVTAILGLAIGRFRWSALAAVVAASIVGGYILAGDWFVLNGVWLQVSGVAVAAGAVAAVSWPNVSAATTSVTAGAITLAGSLWWRPCVGEQLGTILTAAPDALVSQLLPTTAYMLGAAVPAVAVGLAYQLLDPPAKPGLAISRVAAFGLVVIGGAIALGRHDDLVATLTRWTLT